MHMRIIHNKCGANFKDLGIAMLNVLHKEVLENWAKLCPVISVP